MRMKMSLKEIAIAVGGELVTAKVSAIDKNDKIDKDTGISWNTYLMYVEKYHKKLVSLLKASGVSNASRFDSYDDLVLVCKTHELRLNIKKSSTIVELFASTGSTLILARYKTPDEALEKLTAGSKVVNGVTSTFPVFIKDRSSAKNTILVSISFGKTQGAGVKLDKKTANELYGKLNSVLKQYGK